MLRVSNAFLSTEAGLPSDAVQYTSCRTSWQWCSYCCYSVLRWLHAKLSNLATCH